MARTGNESTANTTYGDPELLDFTSLSSEALMVKATISAMAMAALQLITAERALKSDRHAIEMRIVSSDANSNQLQLGFKKAVTIDLSADIKDILVADPGTVKVVPRTTRRVYIIGSAVGKTNVFFYDDKGQEIAALDVWVSEIAQPQPAGPDVRPGHRDPVSRRFLKGLRLSD
jgi:Flp pilus assembly secretin CpaC